MMMIGLNFIERKKTQQIYYSVEIPQKIFKISEKFQSLKRTFSDQKVF